MLTETQRLDLLAFVRADKLRTNDKARFARLCLLEELLVMSAPKPAPRDRKDYMRAYMWRRRHPQEENGHAVRSELG